MITRIFFCFLLVVSLSGCGYTFTGSGSTLPPDVKRVYIPLVQNNSSEPGIARVMTEALRDRFDRYGAVTVVDSDNEADAILTAKILRLVREADTVQSNTDRTLQQQTSIIMSSELKRRTGEVLFRNPQMVVTASYGTQSDVVVTSSSEFAGGTLNAQDLERLDVRELSRGQERQALDDLADQAAKRIYDEAVAPDF
jgi:Lipopolysaccharide-assembly